MEHTLAAHALAHKPVKTEAKKTLKEFHAKEVHDGSYHTAKHDGKGAIKEGSAKNLDEVHDQMEEHMGGPMAQEQCANCSDPDCPGCGGSAEPTQ